MQKKILYLILLVLALSGKPFAQNMEYLSSSIKQVTVNNRVAYQLEIVTKGVFNPLSITNFTVSKSIKGSKGSLQIYYTSNDSVLTGSDRPIDFVTNKSTLSFSTPPSLKNGTNFIWAVLPSGTKLADANASIISSFEIGLQQYKEVWADEFTNSTIDSANWKFEKGFVRNYEDQWYQEENANCKNGLLVIEARREKRPNPNYVAGSSDWRHNREFIEYTSSSIHTSGKQTWLYGRFEMKARIDTVLGYWPAWWTLGVNKPWPSNGEIDIMEYYKGKVLANIAVGTKKSNNAFWFSKTFPVKFYNTNWKNEFHTWRMDWDEEGVGIFIDGILINYQPQSNLYNRDGSDYFPFKQKHYMLLNLAIGGLNGGNPEKVAFPLKYEIDYVRVYQKVTNRFTTVGIFKPIHIRQQ